LTKPNQKPKSKRIVDEPVKAPVAQKLKPIEFGHAKTMLAIGDLHIGSEGAIMPEEVNSDDCSPGRNHRYFPNQIQKDIYKKWEEMVQDVPRPDILLLNGDLVDGKNYKENGMGSWTTDSLLQARVLADLVKMIKPRQILATSGSPYHTDRNPNVDKIAVEMCGGTFKGGYANININGKRIYAQHKVSVSKSSWQYRTTPLGRALVLAALNEKEMGHYDIVLKSHAHYFCYAGFSNSLGMILPSWKAYDAFLDTNIEFPNPSLGYVRFDFSGGDFSFAHNIFHFKGKDLMPDVMV
jgi:hypothetical protein